MATSNSVLPFSLLLLSIASILGHGKPHTIQSEFETHDHFEEARRLLKASRVEAPQGMVVIGDMRVPESVYELLFKSSVGPRKGIFLEAFLWRSEDGVPTVPYEFANEIYKNEIEAGLKHWEEHTCINFRPRRTSDTNWIRFIHGNGCYSSVGQHSNGQDISIGTGCQSLRTVVHEVGHALGLFHEQMRNDRDDHVVINWHNIPSSFESNFQKSMFVDNRSVPYDYTSVMHYSSSAFSSNRRNTIATMDPMHQGLIGRLEQLSHRDKHIVNLMYGCIDQWETTCQSAGSCEGEGYRGRDCTCVCPPGLEGSRCEVKTGEYYDNFLPTCSATMNSERNFTSPNYPENLPGVRWCMYKIEAPSGNVPEVTFHHFNLEPNVASKQCTNILEVRDKNMHDGKVFCGSEIKKGQSFVGASRSLYLYLEVNRALSNGFKAEITFHNASNPPEPKGGGTSGLVPSSTMLLLVFILVTQVLTRV